MIHQEKIIDLKLKKVEMEIEREKEIHKFSVSILVGFISFLVTTGYLFNAFNKTIELWIKAIVQFPSPLNWILVLVILITLPIISGVLAMIFIQFLFKTKEKIYFDGIKKIDALIKEYSPKKNSSKPSASRSRSARHA